MTNPDDQVTRCGCVAIVGRPNVGKSSLLNHLLASKVSITSRRAQTTRHQIMGVLTQDATQIIFVDTPGIQGRGPKKALNRFMNKAALSTLNAVDAIVWVVEAMKFTEGDAVVLQHLESVEVPVILLVNKVDLVHPKEKLLPFLQDLQSKRAFASLIPVSARKGTNLPALVKALRPYLHEEDFLYEETFITDKTENFRITEIVREKLMRTLGEELPYATTVTLEHVVKDNPVWELHGNIWVERESQKAIVIGDGGHRLKKMSQESREDIEKLLGRKIYLRLWVKVRSDWSDNESDLNAMGYEGDGL